MNLWNKYFLRWNAEHMDATYTKYMAASMCSGFWGYIIEIIFPGNMFIRE